MSHLPSRRISRTVRVSFLFWLILVCPLLAWANSEVVNTQSPPASASSNLDVAKRIDPTDFKNRFDLRSEYVEYSGGSVQAIVPRLDYAVSKSLGFRVELPIERFRPAAGPSIDGISNLVTRVAWRPLRTDDVSVVVGTELILDTASSPKLGNGKNVLAPFVFAAFDLPRAKSVFFPYIQHGKAVGGDASREDVEYTNLRASFLTRLPAKAYSFIEYSHWIDHQRSNVVSSQIKAELGRFVLPNTGVYIRPGTGLSGTDQRYGMHWSLDIGLRHFF
ncbi:MAG: hypothetical protein EBZ75_05385 [Oxalobacteraceae bacterium]|nr:hypothetical protein [Oxalobacteraceae bacterium]